MKIKKVVLKDDGVYIPGHLIVRLFRKPVFHPFDESCGFTSRVIHDKSVILDSDAMNKEIASYSNNENE